MLGSGVVLTLALIGGGVFGLYLPSTPASVWSTGINRSGKAVDGIVQAATVPDKLKSYGTSIITGSANVQFDGSTYSGHFNTSFDRSSQDGGFDFTMKDKSDASKTVSAKVLSQIPANSVYPNVYFQITGLKALGLDQLAPGASDYDGKWISISSDYLKSLGDSYIPTGDNTKDRLTASDIAEVARAASTVTKNYVFSTDKDKAVFVQKSFVGKEKMDGLGTYHYKVGIDKARAKGYCVALDNAMLSTGAYKKLSGDSASDISKAKQSASKDCADSTKDIKASDTFDMWIDGHYKLIHKIRVYDQKDKGIYTEVGQNYRGGDELSLFVNYHDTKNKADGSFTLDTNLETNSTKGTLMAKSASKDLPFNFTLTLTATASDKPVKIKVPTGAVSIQDVMKKLGLAGDNTTSTPSGGLQGKAADSKRQTDINALDSHIEAYYAENGAYPTLAQLNDESWRATNMEGFDSTGLTPPNSAAKTLASAASASQYAYVPSDCDDDATTYGCQSFAISALLSDGTAYSKTSL